MIAVSWGMHPKELRRSIPSLRSIADEVCKKYGVSYADFISRRRPKSVTIARQEAYWRARRETSASYPEIARAFGRYDHTTVMYGARKHEQRMSISCAT